MKGTNWAVALCSAVLSAAHINPGGPPSTVPPVWPHIPAWLGMCVPKLLQHCQSVKDMPNSTEEPLNKGHVGTRSFVLYREVSFIQRLECTCIIGIGTSRFVLYIERCSLFGVSFISGSTVFAAAAELNDKCMCPIKTVDYTGTQLNLYNRHLNITDKSLGPIVGSTIYKVITFFFLH